MKSLLTFLALLIGIFSFSATSQYKIKIDTTKEKSIKEVRLSKIKSVKSEKEKEGFAVNVIETKKYQNRNMQTLELLDRSVGVRVRQNGGMGSDVNFNINGMSGQSIRILIDGVPASMYGSSFDINSIPVSMIDRIEVYKGVVPGNLSDDSLGGNINIVLNKKFKTSAFFSGSYGSFNTHQYSLNASHRDSISGFTTKVSTYFNYSDNDYKVSGDFVRITLPNGRLEKVTAKRFNDAYRSHGGIMEFGFTNKKWADQFMIGYTGSDAYKEVQHGTYMTKPYKGRFLESDAHLLNFNYSKKNLFVNGLNFSLNGVIGTRNRVVNDTVKHQYNWLGQELLDSNGKPLLSTTGAQQGRVTIANINRKTRSARAELSYAINKNHHFIFNHLYQNINRNDDDLLLTELERKFRSANRQVSKNISTFTYALNAFQNKLKTNVFVKKYTQYISREDPRVPNPLEPNTIIRVFSENKTEDWGYGFASSYLVEKAIMITSSFEKTVRLPTESEVFGDLGDNIVENFGIKAEKSLNSNLGVKFGAFQLNNHQISLGLNAFYKNTQDQIVQRLRTNISDGIQVEPFENLGKTKSYGIDAELNYSWKNKLFINANFSKFDSRFNQKYDANGQILALYDKQLPRQPYRVLSGNANYQWENFLQKNAKLQLFYSVLYVKSFYNVWILHKGIAGYEPFKIPNQLIHDFGIAYTFPNARYTISFDAKNLFNAHAFDNFAVQKPGRSFFAKFAYQFN